MTSPQTTPQVFPPHPIEGGIRITTPSTWVDDRGRVYVALEYIFSDIDSIQNNLPEGVMIYELITETRFKQPVLEFHKRIQTGKLRRYADSLAK